MAWQVRKDTNANRLNVSLASGEPFWTTDTKKMFVGDGSTLGGIEMTATSAYGDLFNVMYYGAVGDGVTDDSAALQAAIDAASSAPYAVVTLPAKTFAISTSLVATDKAVTIEGYGAEIIGPVAAIVKTDHNDKLIVRGVKFSNAGDGIQHNSAPWIYGGDEIQVEDCIFNVSGGAWGIYCAGTREPRITKCTFLNGNGGNGVYFKDAVAPYIDKCIFLGSDYSGTAVYYPGTGAGTDAGLVIRDTEIMGWNQGIISRGCDWLCVEGCTIDYNAINFKIASQDAANISGCYIGSLGANPAIWITSDAAATSPNFSTKIIITNCSIVGHYTGGNTYDCILIDGSPACDEIIIANNNIHFYTRYGINFKMNSTRLRIQGNNFGERPAFGVSPIFNSATALDSGVTIKDNFFSNACTIADMAVVYAEVNENTGCVTEATGEAFAGVGVFTYNQPHGCSYTPVQADIQLTATNPQAADRNPYINSVNATNIVIGFTTATSATAGVAWRVRRKG